MILVEDGGNLAKFIAEVAENEARIVFSLSEIIAAEGCVLLGRAAHGEAGQEQWKPQSHHADLPPRTSQPPDECTASEDDKRHEKTDPAAAGRPEVNFTPRRTRNPEPGAGTSSQASTVRPERPRARAGRR